MTAAGRQGDTEVFGARGPAHRVSGHRPGVFAVPLLACLLWLPVLFRRARVTTEASVSARCR
ncbi:hypothetical protein DMA15_34765 [Streptomyces sp. WAC 01529]|nr:hypothetical protein DMA15_34765 [Streptomyces sp. WAC 01529]